MAHGGSQQSAIHTKWCASLTRPSLKRWCDRRANIRSGMKSTCGRPTENCAIWPVGQSLRKGTNGTPAHHPEQEDAEAV
ncbi:unnamed protein product [Staurois parvus]|uniref:Uncharacterized protein n=1 Tax=Staurois parvus TaxID=386267 RepID=A0ABN9BMH1_9NEOB|nr:unnamed protein product [Staurois parvus]